MGVLTFGSLFTGFGGLDLGLEMAGLACKWQVEIGGYANRVLELRWPGVRRERDVRLFPDSDPDWRKVDLIAGGDPCQENSLARSGSRTTQPSLGHEFVRVVGEIRPRLVLRENPSRVRADAPWPWWRFRAELERLGYSVLPFRLRACCVGADHQRDRLFLLASLPDSDREQQGFRRREQLPEGREEARRVGVREDQPEPPRVADGVPDRLERNRGLGNAVDVRVGYEIGRRLMDALQSSIPQEPR